MCSICGGNYPLEIIQKASQAMVHRGPDFSGSFSDGIFSLAHNRLSIIDLDLKANQPFTSPYCPHLKLVFNGEIYNYLELKAELEALGIPFFTHSDTEVLLHAFVAWQEKCVHKFNGDFAFVIYDERDSSLFLARDRLGNKPLFYQFHGDKILFASEIKAFLAIKDSPFDLEEVSKWLLFSNGSENRTIYQDIFSFPKAHFAKFKLGGKLGDKSLRFQKYWEFEPNFEEINYLTYDNKSFQKIMEELEFLLFDATKLRLRSDVPMALCVSGGIDSSILAHLIQKVGVNCRYFALNFKDNAQGDESVYARELQKDLNQKIEFINPSLDSIKEDFKALCYTQDEVFRSLSIYSQYLLFASIAPYCKVSLGGQGADELFGGYYHHVGRYIFDVFREFEERLKIYGNSAFGEYNFGLKCSLKKDLKLQLFAQDNAKEIEKLEKLGFPIPPLDNLLKRFQPDFTQGLWLDTIAFNLPNLLRYEDRNAMVFGIENRTPFTDFRVVEFAFKIAKSCKVQKGYSKFILRMLLEKLGSKGLAWRKDKIGFSAPEFCLMQTLGYNATSLFDIRLAIFEVLKARK
ncbi:asparagine synthase (glutamine-hydrolyzing) [Helicobacter sp. MIT 11-5569]|uniref:asparagine synthase (glutamine-hydrolyzing) n=1 Tax=Helicobacter sp. MIT 11-5569 TaxID=1548151 RepID=UPI00051FD3DC|nr:asparagine synthase (glutamine-hydrolyzing) [Helicobacter sp. MIT 11-5569]TLD81373.1 asparagine synthase (glutamine-hydrolyzing) [Helicobacter sp. MIT 11-5569]